VLVSPTRKSNGGAVRATGEPPPAPRLRNYFRDTFAISGGLAVETIAKPPGNVPEASRIGRIA
jgi:hypothetical protein